MTGRSRCPAHAPIVDADARGTAHQRGYTKDWARYSQDRLAQFPYCADPFRIHPRRVQATCTDHKVPAKVAPGLFWDPTNHQSLCASCNARKGGR